jgi:predicted DNA-binding transcriptional regulator AlpA
MTRKASTLPPSLCDALIDRRAICQLLGVSRPTLDRMESAGKIPARIELSSQCHRWRLSVIRQWIEAGCPAPETARR